MKRAFEPGHESSVRICNCNQGRLIQSYAFTPSRQSLNSLFEHKISELNEGGTFLFSMVQILIKQANSGEPDQTPHFAASDLGLQCLPMPR